MVHNIPSYGFYFSEDCRILINMTFANYLVKLTRT